jgi:hypothetical protein
MLPAHTAVIRKRGGIMQAIENLDADVLHADLLPQLVATIPSQDDITAVREAVDVHGSYEEVRERLGAAETFFMELHRVRRVHAKVKVLQFKQDFVEMLTDITVRHCLVTVLPRCIVSGLEACIVSTHPRTTFQNSMSPQDTYILNSKRSLLRKLPTMISHVEHCKSNQLTRT